MNIISQTTKIYSGEGAMESLRDIKNSKVLVMSDGFLVKNKMINMVLDNLDKTNTVEIFDDIKPDPPLSVVSKAMAKMIQIDAEYLIGFGGGSAIDTAKGTIYFLKQAGKLKKDLEFIAIPTTSGTGSEVTSYAVITDTVNSVKIPIKDEEMMPKIAILDPEFTRTLPKSVVADGGIDALTHAIEAYSCSVANFHTQIYAMTAIKGIF